MSPFATETAVSHLIFTAMDCDEDSDELQDTINVAIDLTSSESLRPRPRPPSEAVDSSSEAPYSDEAPESSNEAPKSSDDLVVLNCQPLVTTSSANPTRTRSEPFLLLLPRRIQPAAKDSQRQLRKTAQEPTR